MPGARLPTIQVAEPSEPPQAARQHVSHQVNEAACHGDALAERALQAGQVQQPRAHQPPILELPSAHDLRVHNCVEQLVQNGAMGDPGAAARDGTGWNDVDAIFSKQCGRPALIPDVLQTDVRLQASLMLAGPKPMIHGPGLHMLNLVHRGQLNSGCSLRDWGSCLMTLISNGFMRRSRRFVC